MSELDLPTRIMNYLQEKKTGKTPEELAQHFNAPQNHVLAALHYLRQIEFVTSSEGKWSMKQDR